jgi:hypothetical protein
LLDAYVLTLTTGNQQDLSAATAEELLSELRFATNLMDEKQVDTGGRAHQTW